MDRIAIIGCSGGGKSTLAQRLGERLGLPVVHLDVLYWAPNWTKGDYAAFRARLAEAVAGERWVADGNFPDSGDLHFARADLIVWVDHPRLLCLWRSIWRVVATRGRRRPDLPEGCAETFDPWLWGYIWNWDRVTRSQIEAALSKHAPATPIVRLRNDREIAAWLASLPHPISAST
jgi:adenylate kinase family enzyme